VSSPEISAPEIPERIEDLTPDWLTRVLRSSGTLREASVVGVRSEILGEGEGFIGQIARLTLELDAPEPSAPATLIAKLPTTIAVNRALGEMLGAYEREIRYYTELAEHVSLVAPRHYYSAMEPNPLAGREEEALRFVNRVPVWILRLLIPIILWTGRRNQRRYVLLIEDLADARMGDQVAGCEPDRAERLARAMAANQAALWNSGIFEDRFWLFAFDLMPWVTQLTFRRNRKRFYREYGSRLNPSVPAVVDWLDRNGVALMRYLGSSPHAYLHGDFRLDNLFFRDEDPDAPNWLTVIDYQGVGFGRGAFDLAYFTTGNIPAEILPDCESTVVSAYHDELTARGISDYPPETCWRDYQLSKIFLLHRLIAGAGLIDLSHERGEKILDRTFDGILATLPKHDLDELLADAVADREA
jgi:hypothetical protein